MKFPIGHKAFVSLCITLPYRSFGLASASVLMLVQRFSNVFEVGTTVPRTTLLLFPLIENLSILQQILIPVYLYVIWHILLLVYDIQYLTISMCRLGVSKPIQSIKSSAQGQVFHCKFSILHSTFLSAFLFISSQSIYHNVVYHIFCLELSSHLPYLLEHPSADSSFLASGPANFFSPSFFHSFQHNCIFFIRSILLHTHISNASSCFCSFCCCVQVSAPYNTTLHTKHFTSLLRSSFCKGQGAAYIHKYINKRRDQATLGL